MAPTEMIQNGNPPAHQQPATPPCSPGLSSPEYSRLSSRAENPSLFQSAQAPTIDDLEQLNLKLVKAQLSVWAEESKDGESVAHELGDREIHGSGEDTSVNSLPLFHRDGWELIDFSPDSDLSRDASSDEGPVDNTSTENLEPAEYWIDLDVLGGFDLTNETSSDQALSGTSFNLADFCRPAVPGPSFDNKLGGKVLARL